ncbi:hypothetical protein [Luteolibacter marinus]|uniref:hypothetical protein n=1 Tax=Luteolibacter marinus TaxID=2776705 RepID=UPI001867C7FC|nr:hypothetical protein [Luteolibacter marinus]
MKTMKLLTRAFACAGAALLAASCAETRNATVQQPDAIRSARSAYVVKPGDSSRDVEVFLRDSIASKGVKASTGSLSAKPASADLYVTFVDRWHWDMAMYLRTLDVSVVDNRSGKEVASAMYRNSALHGYPDARKTCEELVNLIYAKAN